MTEQAINKQKQQTLSYESQAYLRFGVRQSRAPNAGPNEYEMLDANPGGQVILMHTGTKAECELVKNIAQKAYVAGCTFNSDRVLIDGMFYSLNKDQ